MRIAFDNSYAQLPDEFFRRIPLEAPKAPHLIRWNQALADHLEIDTEAQAPDAIAAALSGGSAIDGAQPIAMAYAGHQFGGFVPQLGDGRAVLLGEVLGRDEKRYDIHLKGSGRTPFSRRGDGKSALGPALREYIVSESMAALGIPTTRALAVVGTGETVYRDEPKPGAIFARIARSHIRIGTFEYFAAREQPESLRTLLDYTLRRLYPERADSENPALALLDAVIERQATLIAQWMRVGFIHGVMNTDNMNLSGETIDFGPCAFLDEYNPAKVFSSIDQHGRYAYHAQGQIGLWNLTRFAEALLPLIDTDQDRAVERAKETLERYPKRHSEALRCELVSKIGLDTVDEDAIELIERLLRLMEAEGVDFTLFFHQLTHGLETGEPSLASGLFRDPQAIELWIQKWRARVDSEDRDTVTDRMRRANPVRIPRNHRIEAAIESAENGDFALFHRMVEAMDSPYEPRPQFSEYEIPPKVEERVAATFCGT